MNLYQINSEIQALIIAADENGEIDARLFDQLQITKSEKQLNIIKFIKHLENDEEAIKGEFDRLKVLKEQAAKRKESLTRYLAESMRIDGVTELDFTTFKAKFKKNPPKLLIADDAKLPDEYTVTKIDIQPDKDKIKAAIKAGQEIVGCRIEQGERLDII